jgi:hypothetical protein
VKRMPRAGNPVHLQEFRQREQENGQRSPMQRPNA